MSFAESALEAIGQTPLVALDRLAAGRPGRVLAKVEFYSPGLSVKDRVARYLVEQAERAGRLRPGDTVVELTSGNMGVGLAIVCAIKGYRFIAVMSEGNSPERRRMLEALGAEVELVPQAGGPRPGRVSGDDLARVEERTQRLARELGAFRPDQFNNPDSARAHELTTGAELLAQTGGRLDAFVAAVGTGGTFAGVARALKRHRPSIRCYAVEPAGAPVLAGQPVREPRHRLQGIGYAFVPPLWDAALCDGTLGIGDAEAIAAARALARREGLFCGFSSGANVAAALRVAAELPVGAVIATVLPDSGLKYLSTDLMP